MTTSPLAQPAAAAPRPHSRRVTDAPTRMFHWLFALSFTGAYLSGDSEHWRALHVTLGYTMAGLLGFRVLYGMFGPRHARLGLLWRKVAGLPAWLRSSAGILRTRSSQGIAWRQAQNLAMGLAILALLLLVVPLTLSGYAVYNSWGGEWLEEVHELFGNVFLLIVLGHLALLAGLSLLRRKNQAAPMLTGRVEGNGPDLVPHNRSWLAALLLMAVLAFGAWEWQQSPQGLLPAPAALDGGGDPRGHDDDD